MDRMRAAALIAQTRLRRRRRPVRPLRRAGRPRFPAHAPARVGPADAAPFADLPGPAVDKPASDDRQPDHVSAVYLRHHGMPKGVLHSDNTLLANRAHDGARLASGRRGALYAEPADPQPRARRLDHRAGGRRRTGGPRPAARHQPRSTGWKRPALNSCSACRRMQSTCWRRCGRAATGLGRLRGFRISGAAAPATSIAELMRMASCRKAAMA